MTDLSEKIFKLAESYRDEAVALLRRLIAVPGESNEEGARLKLLKSEIERLDACDRAFFDSFGNLCWVVGEGERTIFFDGHTDTVGIGQMQDWVDAGLHPFDGKYEDGWVWGRGAADQLSGVVNQVFATKIIKKLGLGRQFSVYSIGSVAEEANDGGGPRWIFTEGIRSNLYPRPEVVLLSEGTGDETLGPLGIYRGHRGRMEIVVETFGRSVHGSNPDIGDNAIVAMAPVIQDIHALQQEKQLVNDPFLGRGSMTISRIEDRSPSNNCVAPYCRIIIDRRLTFGESRAAALAQILNLPSVRALGSKIKVGVNHYTNPTWTGYKVADDICYPAWATAEDDPAIKAAISTYKTILSPRADKPRYEGIFSKEPRMGRWIFSTDGVGIPNEIPTFGVSSGTEQFTHIIEERVDSREMVGAIAFMALFPIIYVHQT